jgi:fumarate reductase flavoprotein subunit
MPSERWDVIVVGGGGAGLAAAVASSQAGARTLVLEKAPSLGGSTRLAVGSISAPGTRLQRRRGITDAVESFAADSKKFTGDLASRDNTALRATMAAEAGDTVAWLESLGVAFVGPFPEPPHRVPRMLNVVPGSHAYVTALARQARRQGAEIQTGVRVTGLVQSGGRVEGVELESAGGMRSTLLARGGVVLATGDFSSSPEMKAKFIRPEAGPVAGINPLSTGDGHVMGAAAGGELVNMDITDGPQLRFRPPPAPSWLARLPSSPLLWRVYALAGNALPRPVIRFFAKQLLTAWMAPAGAFLQAVLIVNRDGKRVDDHGQGFAYAVAGEPDATAFLIVSEALARRFSNGVDPISTAPGIAYADWNDYRRGRPDLITRGTSVAELATKLSMRPEILAATVSGAIDRAQASGQPSPFARGPYYAMGPVHSIFVTTEGGLRVNEECRVLNPQGHPIPGLWAAGSVGQAGLVLNGHGLHILWAMASGRISGRSAAAALAR